MLDLDPTQKWVKIPKRESGEWNKLMWFIRTKMNEMTINMVIQHVKSIKYNGYTRWLLQNFERNENIKDGDIFENFIEQFSYGTHGMKVILKNLQPYILPWVKISKNKLADEMSVFIRLYVKKVKERQRYRVKNMYISYNVSANRPQYCWKYRDRPLISKYANIIAKYAKISVTNGGNTYSPIPRLMSLCHDKNSKPCIGLGIPKQEYVSKMTSYSTVRPGPSPSRILYDLNSADNHTFVRAPSTLIAYTYETFFQEIEKGNLEEVYPVKNR